MIVGVSWSFCFLFKQKTAYDMRISDWSSDVCSSDLLYISNGWIDLDAGFSSKNRNAFPYDWRFRATLALEDPAAGKQRDRRHRRCQTHRFIHLHGPHFRPEHRHCHSGKSCPHPLPITQPHERHVSEWFQSRFCPSKSLPPKVPKTPVS